MHNFFRCYASVSLTAIEENIIRIREKLPKETSLMVIIKADAYGHGAVAVGKHIEKLVDSVAVATVEEGVELRKAGIKLPILVLGYSSSKQYEQMMEYDIMPTVYNFEAAKSFSRSAVQHKKEAGIHIALDTGMTRIGFRANEASADIIKEISKLPNIRIDGIFSHLSCADTDSEQYTNGQFEEYDNMIELLKKRSVDFGKRHICNSAGIMKYPEKYYECVRAGIISYGMYPSEAVDKELLELKPALEWKTHVINISEVEADRGVSYGATYVTSGKKTRIATLSVGYADGYPRSLSSKGEVLIKGKRAHILGRVCMDQMMVDITDIPDVKIEETVTLIGRDGDEFISIEELSEKAGSFNYEMACGIGKRVERIYSK